VARWISVGGKKLAMRLRPWWGHEFADTAQPVTTSFIGVPATSFTTHGASPGRDNRAEARFDIELSFDQCQ
jgi:hypothetical protein